MESTRRLAAIMFTDIVGYTAMMGEDEDKAFELLEKNRLVQKPIIEKFNGRWLKEIGDGVLASFTTVSDAVYCAKAIQEACHSEDDLKLRIGIHQGEVVFRGEDVFGDGVNIASRLEPLAPIGGILVSESVNRNLGNKKGIETKFVREETLKNVKDPIKVYEVKVEAEETPASTYAQPTKDESKSGTKKAILISAGAVILVVLALAFCQYQSNESSTPAQTTVQTEIDKSIAVLPFTDMSPDKDQEWFSDGMMEEILNSLVQIADLKVTSRTTVMRFRGSAMSLKEIGQELSVANILEGSVRRQGDRLRITVQLIDVETDQHLWSETYDRTMDDVFAIQSEVAQQIAASLQAEINPEVRLRIDAQPTNSTDAYDLYLRGLAQWRLFTKEGEEEGMKLFEEAIEIDPEFADAYAFLGILKSSFVWAGLGRVNSPQEAFETSKPYFEKALELEPYNLDGHLFSAWHHLWYKWDFENAEKEYQFLIKLEPKFSWADFVIAMGRFDEAVKRAEVAWESDPLSSSSWANKILSYYFNGQYEESLQAIGIAQNGNFRDIGLTVAIARVLLFMGMYDKVIETVERFFVEYEDYKDAPRPVCHLAIAYYHVGDLDKSTQLLNRLKERSEVSSAGSPSFHIALVYAQMGEIDTAFEWLDKAYEDHEVEMYWLKVEPPFEPLRSDPRWQVMLDKVGFPK